MLLIIVVVGVFCYAFAGDWSCPLAVRAWDGGHSVWVSSTGLPVLATLLSSSCPDGLALLDSFVDRAAPIGPVLCSLFPVV